ncbi:2-C-methyl-D-erythritol 2,4-cyclodiphosphate synthase [Candidatus Peregrinibacteria bacterium]|nr:2-C-methyl-D-erythritol 2,4-cyclodiphosphate synthase [Candidatus Peregrinibacteria bacterium]
MNIALIAAAGESLRIKSKINKLLLPVLGKPLIYYTIAAFYDHPLVNKIVIIVNKKILREVKTLCKKFFPGNSKEIQIILGGRSRSESVLAGVKFLENAHKLKENDILVIHNGANPLVTYDEIDKCINIAAKKGACITAHSIRDTLKEIKNKKIVRTHKRENFIRAQTPQAFRFSLFEKALQKAGKTYQTMTDESLLFEKAGIQVEYIDAHEHNFKITTSADYHHAKHILGDIPQDYIFGIGQDSHEFCNKKGLVLGGASFPYENRLLANSDGDVVLHAICNAVLQAIGEKSLGAFADDLCKNQKIRDSKKYLSVVLKKAEKKKYTLNHLGIMIEAKKPRIDNIQNLIKNSLSKLSGLDIKRIGITATSGEKLTSFGRGKGIQCLCIASLKRSNNDR